MLPVSVILPCYNSTETLPWVLESILAQTIMPAELIVVDDGSRDDPGALVERYRDRLGVTALVLIRQKNQGPAATRNAGIRQATQQLVALIDGDDCWLAGKLEAQVKVFEDPKVVLSGTDFYVVRDLAEPRKRLTVVKCSEVQRRVGDGPAGLYGRNYIATSTVMARTAVLRELGGFDGKIPVMEDHDLWQRMARVGRVVVVAEPLMEYLDRPGSLSKKAHLMWKMAIRLAWRYRPGFEAFAKQVVHVTLRRVKNALVTTLRRGPLVGGAEL